MDPGLLASLSQLDPVDKAELKRNLAPMCGMDAESLSDDHLMSLMMMMGAGDKGGGKGGGTPCGRYEKLETIRKTEASDTEDFLAYIEEAFEDSPEMLHEPGYYVVDLGSGCGYIAAQYQLEFPELTVIASDVEYRAEGPEQEGHPSLALLKKTLGRFLEDHREKLGKEEKRKVARKKEAGKNTDKQPWTEEELVTAYEKMVANCCEIDVLAPCPWAAVKQLTGKCTLVTNTMLLHQKAFETPEMWRNVMLGASLLLRPGGKLFIKDGNVKTSAEGGLDDEAGVRAFAAKVGLTVCSYSKEEDHFGSLFAVICGKPASALPPDEAPKAFAIGDLVAVDGLVGAKEHNGCTGILRSVDADTGRWAVEVATGVTAKRRLKQLKIKPENLIQMMPAVRLTPSSSIISIGCEVELCGLQAGYADQNGMRGMVKAWDPSSQKWEVASPDGKVELMPEKFLRLPVEVAGTTTEQRE
eukprot:TRINITY_DN97214_c0_g1_i1.p1 TRINITY_DN97214_c0_g1~~TRINITY_DN97214_c0_g1_i1.p1  ORF type:complete len:470 (+),score=102.82 TRINITY_DN97214_c0_g1_i1:72-1481(+)